VGPGPGGADAESGTTAARQRGLDRRREEEADAQAPRVSDRERRCVRVGCWAGNARWAGRADRRLAAAEMGWNSGWAKRKERERFALFFFFKFLFPPKTNKQI
jgi:hypothetical protein